MDKKLLYCIADFSSGEFEKRKQQIAEVLLAGVDYIQLREKEISSKEYFLRAKLLREMTVEKETKLIINDRLDIALLSGADGVHLGASDLPVGEARKFTGPGFIIGATAKTAEQAVSAEREGANYLGSGAWFDTHTKQDAVPIADETYREILSAITIPDVAVGGITVDNCERPISLGASGLAVSAGLLDARNITEAVQDFRKKMEG